MDYRLSGANMTQQRLSDTRKLNTQKQYRWTGGFPSEDELERMDKNGVIKPRPWTSFIWIPGILLILGGGYWAWRQRRTQRHA